MDDRKITLQLLRENIDLIGFTGTAIRGLDFIASKFSEPKILRKYVDKHILPNMFSNEEIPLKKIQPNLNCEHTIWVCWFQGMENAPQLVQKCFESLRHFNKSHRIIVITEDNISEFIEFPQHIIDKYKKGIIKRAHFSDILRVALLYCYGGLWVDSTMFFTDSIPDFIWNSDLFVFKFAPHESKYQVASSQFIRAKSGDEILRRTLLGLFDYWKKKNKLITYYLFHYVFASAVDSSIELRERFNKIPLLLGAANHILQWRQSELFTEVEWEGG